MKTSSTTLSRRLWPVALLAVVVLAGCGEDNAKPGEESEGESSESDDSYAAPPRAECEVEKLEVPKSVSVASAGDASANGEVIATGFGGTAGVWRDGEFTELDVVPDKHPVPGGVNADGTVAGTNEDGGKAWRYSDGAVDQLKPPDGKDDILTIGGINDDGTVVGDTPEEPLIWRPGAITATTLDIGDSEEGSAIDIADDGTVVGSRSASDGDLPWMWDAEGNGTALPELSEDDYAEGAAIAGDWILLGSFNEGYYRWNKSKKGKPEKVDIVASDIDAKGRVYGSGENFAEMWVKGKTMHLTGLSDEIAGEADNPLHSVTSASEDGKVLAGYSDDKPVRWTCD